MKTIEEILERIKRMKQSAYEIKDEDPYTAQDIEYGISALYEVLNMNEDEVKELLDKKEKAYDKYSYIEGYEKETDKLVQQISIIEWVLNV